MIVDPQSIEGVLREPVTLSRPVALISDPVTRDNTPRTSGPACYGPGVPRDFSALHIAYLPLVAPSHPRGGSNGSSTRNANVRCLRPSTSHTLIVKFSLSKRRNVAVLPYSTYIAPASRDTQLLNHLGSIVIVGQQGRPLAFQHAPLNYMRSICPETYVRAMNTVARFSVVMNPFMLIEVSSTQ